MEQYEHRVSGIFATEAAATQAHDRLQSAQLDAVKIFKLSPGEGIAERKIEPESEATRDAVLHDTLLGAGIGGATGAAGTAALAAANVGLVVASPVAATLVALGYGATIGSLAGAIKGLRINESDFAAFVQDALRNSAWAIIVHARHEKTAAQAEEILRESASEEVITN